MCGDWHRALAPAAAIELVHNFSLIHDDIQDRSLLRRHRPTVWSRWGIAQGINAGDALLIIAQQALFEIEPVLPPDVAPGAFRLLNRACQGLCEGQYLDLLWEDRPIVLVDQYLEMIGKKTACLFSTAAELGAYTSGATERVQHAWAGYGRALGMAFQVVDDLLGVWGPEVDTGKTADLDVATRKKTLPVVLSLGASPSPDADRLRTLFALDRLLTPEETTEATACLTHLGAREATAQVARRYQSEALRWLDDLSAHADVTAVRTLTDTMLPQLHADG